MAERAGTKTRLDPEVRRAQLLEAAISTFIGRDPATVGIDEIAAAAGVSRSLVYAYFGDRTGLLAAVHATLLDRVNAYVGLTDEEIPVLASARVEQAWHGIVRRYLEFARDHAGEWQLLGTIGAMSHAAIRASRDQNTELVARIWAGGPAARLVARAVIGLLDSATHEWREHSELDLDRAARVITKVGWTGLAELGAPAKIS